MITVQNISTNAAQVTVWDLAGFSADVVIPSGRSCDVPGVVVGGETCYGGMRFEGTVLIHDTASGQQVSLLASAPPLTYFFSGGAAALSVLTITFLMQKIRQGLKVRGSTYD